LCFFLLCRWRYSSLPVQKGKGDRVELDPLVVWGCLRRQVEQTRRHGSCSSRSVPLQFLDFLGAIL
jgi:hypothetical protein